MSTIRCSFRFFHPSSDKTSAKYAGNIYAVGQGKDGKDERGAVIYGNYGWNVSFQDQKTEQVAIIKDGKPVIVHQPVKDAQDKNVYLPSRVSKPVYTMANYAMRVYFFDDHGDPATDIYGVTLEGNFDEAGNLIGTIEHIDAQIRAPRTNVELSNTSKAFLDKIRAERQARQEQAPVVHNAADIPMADEEQAAAVSDDTPFDN